MSDRHGLPPLDRIWPRKSVVATAETQRLCLQAPGNGGGRGDGVGQDWRKGAGAPVWRGSGSGVGFGGERGCIKHMSMGVVLKKLENKEEELDPHTRVEEPGDGYGVSH